MFTIMGLKEYHPIAEKYKIPIVVSGFEPADLLQGNLSRCFATRKRRV
jgi:hydrogenase expression/formation protein HypD